jgi:hypothetical protein
MSFKQFSKAPIKWRLEANFQRALVRRGLISFRLNGQEVFGSNERLWIGIVFFVVLNEMKVEMEV